MDQEQTGSILIRITPSKTAGRSAVYHDPANDRQMKIREGRLLRGLVGSSGICGVPDIISLSPNRPRFSGVRVRTGRISAAIVYRKGPRPPGGKPEDPRGVMMPDCCRRRQFFGVLKKDGHAQFGFRERPRPAAETQGRFIPPKKKGGYAVLHSPSRPAAPRGRPRSHPERPGAFAGCRPDGEPRSRACARAPNPANGWGDGQRSSTESGSRITEAEHSGRKHPTPAGIGSGNLFFRFGITESRPAHRAAFFRTRSRRIPPALSAPERSER
jgi:hypothetical protein